MVKTKIICTLGPSSESYTILRKIMSAGMDVARLNLSHGSHGEHRARIDIIRALNKKYRRRVKILLDLEGYRLRIGRFRGVREVELKKGHKVILGESPRGYAGGVIPFDYKDSLRGLKKGSFIYIDDGNIALRVIRMSGDKITAEVVVPGVLKENKGVNIPGASFIFNDITAKDKRDIMFGLKNGVDYIAQSFVRRKKDILDIRKFIGRTGGGCRLIAKIENREGIRNIEEIIDVSDGVMIARGDMGVSLPIYEVPMVQKMIIKKCNRKKKPVITATQMLESMTERIRPTRAEVSDVANAILDGTDYLMLSGETAVGAHPVASVKMMNDIIKFTEHRLGI